ncbi:MAG: DNA-directed RNA polymerase [Nanoarchaeota archaeon]|nr:DNA-directed RNA polymerase [Nanoarchaeota archaeon]MBU1051237.1 DNA-directed RNA polymerase [Nanoarchaeota archaeon]MBU1988558.1 DNA-directed RNA polymerase [Nanoarchaeota archaeon]
MFYILDAEDHVRVEPRHFGLPTHEAVEKQLNEDFADSISREFGYVISILSVGKIDDGIIISGDGAAYYNSQFRLLVWKPELHELTYGTISEITNFGAFIQIGPERGMIHISQTMEDYVSLNKTGTLSGKSSKRSLGKKDDCIARIVAISYKAGTPKIGLTMRQPGLGKLQWLEEDKNKKEEDIKKAAKRAGKGTKGKKGGKK